MHNKIRNEHEIRIKKKITFPLNLIMWRNNLICVLLSTFDDCYEFHFSWKGSSKIS